MSPFTVHHGDCLSVLRTLADNSVDAVVTDPPYGLSFMGKRWDYDVPSVEIWAECLRVLKPGGHLLAFAGTRTQHRMAVRIEDAGFEIRDMIAWVYGTGFPKSLDVGKAIDNASGLSRYERLGERADNNVQLGRVGRRNCPSCGLSRSQGIERGAAGTCQCLPAPPATDAARQWQGWGTALKPALEPITVARKPLVGTVAANVLEHGTGALNIDACRVGTDDTRSVASKSALGLINDDAWQPREVMAGSACGRWPANLIHDGGEPAALLGDAARFFYCAKASKKDRNEGCEHLEAKQHSHDGRETPIKNTYQRNNSLAQNNHPTVKPTDLMRYLCRLVTPPGGIVLDPFMGSGSTGKAAVLEGFRFIGVEREADYVEIARARISAALPIVKTAMSEQEPPQVDLFGGAP